MLQLCSYERMSVWFKFVAVVYSWLYCMTFLTVHRGPSILLDHVGKSEYTTTQPTRAASRIPISPTIIRHSKVFAWAFPVGNS